MITKTITLYTAADTRCSRGRTVRISGTPADVSARLREIEAAPGFIKWSMQSQISRAVVR